MSFVRKIPATMGTQHPDNSSAPYWFAAERPPFISTKDEVEEAYRSFHDLGCEEYMWDWEGKHVDEAMVERFFEHYYKYFSKKQLGKDVFLTFRVPNIWHEKGYRVARAFVNIIAANDFVDEMGLHSPPIFECILPMTTDAQKLYFIRKNYAQFVRAFNGLRKNSGPETIEMIPLVEEVHHMLKADRILDGYVRMCSRDPDLKKRRISHLRPFIARSDPALNAGVVPAVLGAKAALSNSYKFEEESGIPVYPIIGVGSLFFRGGLSPNHVKEFCQEYEGVRTVTVQSAFRYDFGKDVARRAIARLNKDLHARPETMNHRELHKLAQVIGVFERQYKPVVEAIADDVNRVAAFVPSHRERRLHIGLFGYSRKVGKKALPRAIGFTSALYSLGVPPELIGTGRGLREAKKKGLMPVLEKNFSGLHVMLKYVGRYLNRENLELLARRNSAWKKVVEDVALAEEFLGEPLEQEDADDLIHRNITSNILLQLGQKRSVEKEIRLAGQIRHSLG